MLKPINFGSQIFSLERAMTIPHSDPELRARNLGMIPGFGDVLARAGMVDSHIGEGFYYNTIPSVTQLTAAIGLSALRSPDVRAILTEQISAGNAEAMVRRLRAAQVLKGMKMLDLGCGIVPGFALAASTLGAEVHTADTQEIGYPAEQLLASHTVLDLTDPSAADRLQEATGGNFDFVTASSVLRVPEALGQETPSDAQLAGTAAALLAVRGAYFAAPGVTMYFKT